MGVYDTTKLPIYAYLHAPGHPNYVIADHFFQAAFGGSFLNHQWLVAAASPTFPGASPTTARPTCTRRSTTTASRIDLPALQRRPRRARRRADRRLRLAAPAGPRVRRLAVNTIQPAFQPHASGRRGCRRRPRRRSATGSAPAASTGRGTRADGPTPTATWQPGWTNGDPAQGCTDPDTLAGPVFPNCPDKLFQFHHQPLNYYASFAPGTPRPPRTCATRRSSSPAAARRSTAGSSRSVHQADRRRERAPRLRQRAHRHRPPGRPAPGHRGSACAKDTMVVVTYDEFGGQWDHVSPPGQGRDPRAARPWARAPASPRSCSPGPARGSRSTTRRTTRRRSWPRSSTASPCEPVARATPRSRTCRPRSTPRASADRRHVEAARRVSPRRPSIRLLRGHALAAAAVEERPERPRERGDDRDRVGLHPDVEHAAERRHRVRHRGGHREQLRGAEEQRGAQVGDVRAVRAPLSAQQRTPQTRSTTSVTARTAPTRSRRCRWVGVSARRRRRPRARRAAAVAWTRSSRSAESSRREGTRVRAARLRR